jgi:hypothetical protein
MQIVLMLSLNGIENMIDQTKLLTNVFQKTKLNLLSDQIIQKLQPQIQCAISKTSSAELIDAPFTWWQAKGCFGQFDAINFYYVWENIGQIDCAYTLNNDGTKSAIDVYRITLLAQLNSAAKRLLQRVIAIKSTHKLECSDQLTVMQLGEQSLRELF